MSTEERKSIANGIWMCQTHGKLIDSDEIRYTVSQLQYWRKLAERKAHLLQEHPSRVSVDTFGLLDLGLPEHELEIQGMGSENELIGNALNDSCVPQVWGATISHAIRDLAVELARNAFEHGGATYFRLDIQSSLIRMIDNGSDFDSRSLVFDPPTSGGRVAVRHLLDDLSDRLIFITLRRKEENETQVALVSEADEIMDFTPCWIEVTWSEVRERGGIVMSASPSCKVVYVMLPRFLSISDAIRVSEDLEKVEDVRLETRPIVFVLRDTSPKAREIVERSFPTMRVISLSS